MVPTFVSVKLATSVPVPGALRSSDLAPYDVQKMFPRRGREAGGPHMAYESHLGWGSSEAQTNNRGYGADGIPAIAIGKRRKSESTPPAQDIDCSSMSSQLTVLSAYRRSDSKDAIGSRWRNATVSQT